MSALSQVQRKEGLSKDSQRYTLIARVDEPCDPSSRLSNRVYFRGWFIGPKGLLDELPEGQIPAGIEILLETGVENSPLRNKSTMVTRRLPLASDPEGGPFVESIRVFPRTEELAPVALDYAGYAYEINAWINVDELVPENEARTCYLALSVQLGREQTLSNMVEISILPRSDWAKAYGGFLYPETAEISSNYLVVQGWALRMHDPIESVKIYLNDVYVGEAETRIWSTTQRLSIPDPEESKNCQFRLALVYSEHAELVQSRGLQSLRACCLFRSGEELEFSGHEFVWRPKSVDKGTKGQIEKICLTDRGRLCVEGWVFCASLASPRLFLEGIHRSQEISENCEGVDRIVWTKRIDVQDKNLSWALARPYGFSFEINPLLLGRFPGLLRLVAEFGSERGLIGERSDWKKISELVYQRGFHKKISGKLLAFITRLLSSCGLRIAGSLFGAVPGKSFGKWLTTFRFTFPTDLPGTEPNKGREQAPKILFVSHNLSSTEGAPKVLFQVIRKVRRELGEKAQLRMIAARVGALDRELGQLSVELQVEECFDMVQQTWERYSEELLRITDEVSSFAPDVVVANVVDSFWAVDLARRLDIPVLWMIHESLSPKLAFRDAEPRLLTRFLDLLSEADGFIYVAQSTAEVYRPFQAGVTSEVIPNGVDIKSIENNLEGLSKQDARRKIGVPVDALVVSIIGTTTERKGQDIFLREMRLLSEKLRGRDLLFYVVGARSGEFLDSLKRLSQELGIDSKVRFVEETPEISPYFIASDVIVIASREESAPLVSLEALAYARPLVTSDVFGLKEQVQDGKTALVFDLDQPGDLASKVLRILEQPEVAQKLSLAGEKLVRQRFSLDLACDSYFKSLCRLTARN